MCPGNVTYEVQRAETPEAYTACLYDFFEYIELKFLLVQLHVFQLSAFQLSAVQFVPRLC